MAKGYYTVIVGTQPGVYADWTQAAPKVTEIPGNIHKKFKTLAEAWAAYHQAAREGRVRAVRLYPEPEAESPPGSQIQEEALHDYPVVQVQPTFHSATGPGQRFHRSHAAGPMGVGKMTSMGAGPSHLTERMSHDAEPREHHNFGQQYWPAGGVQAVRPKGSSSSRGHSNERREECQHCSARALPILPRAEGSRTAIAYERARSPSPSVERRRRVLDGRSAAALSQSPMSSHGHATTHRVLRSPQMEDSRRFPGNAARQHGRPRSSSPLADGRRPDDMGSPSSDAFSFDFQPHPVNRPLYFEPPRASGSQGPIVNPAASPQAHGMSDKKGKKRASVESSDACLVRSEIQTSASSPQTGIYSLGLPGSLLPSPARSHISLASSSSVFSFEFDVNISVVETPGSPGRSAHVAGSQPAPQPTVSPFAISNSRENAIPGPSTQRQEEGLNEEENGNDSQASSDDTRVEISGDVVDALDRTSSPQADRSVAFDDSPSLSRPLSPLIITSTSRSSTHRLAQSVRPSGPDTTTSSSSWVWPLWSPSLPPHVTSEASSSTEVTGLGLSIEGILSPSSSSQPLQHKTTTQAPPGTPHRHAGNVERQSPTRRDTSPRDAPISQAPATPPNLVSALSNLTQQSGVAPSPRNVPPLPSSPTTSTSGSPVRLQTQPSHRVTPLMPFYPSLVIDDNTPSTPSRLGIASGRPTPQWLPSPIQETAASRTPSAADPRSPISRLTRIPGSIMGISRNLFFGRPTPPGNDLDV